MQLTKLTGQVDVKTLSELKAQLSSRYEERFECFWLCHPNGQRLSMMVNGNEAYVHHFPEDGLPGFRVVDEQPDDWKTTVEFVADNFDRTRVPKAMVVPLFKAEKAFEEFFVSGEQPKSLNWKEL